MNPVERAAKIETYGAAHTALNAAIERYPREMWHFKPAAGQWSIHEIVIHITDSEANSYIRCRRLIAEPGETLMAYDENRWARRLHYPQQSTEEALELFRWLHQGSYRLIRTLPEEIWGHSAYHPEDGTVSLEDWLDTYTRHVPDHIEQMERVFAAWQQRADDQTPTAQSPK